MISAVHKIGGNHKISQYICSANLLNPLKSFLVFLGYLRKTRTYKDRLYALGYFANYPDF